MDGVARLLQALSLTAREIASVTRVSEERVSAIMEGAPANLSELRALSWGLRVPMRAFASGSRPADLEGKVGPLFRGALTRCRPDQRATVDYVASFVAAALDILPTRDTPPLWLADMRPAEQTFVEARRLAGSFRATFMPDRPEDPLTDLPRILTEQVNVMIGGLRLSRYEGASVIAGGYAFAFVSPRFPARMLFTLAHELGHLIAHHGRDAGAVFDGAGSIGSWRQRTLAERFVDGFASMLLLPERGTARALKAIRETLGVKSGTLGDVEILYLARYYGVSFEVAARRCEQLELLPEGGAVSLTQALKRDFKSPERRADLLGLPPRHAIVLPKVSDNLLVPLLQKIEAGQVSTGWASENFGLPISELFEAHAKVVYERRG